MIEVIEANRVLFEIGGFILGGGVIWGAIRADIRNIHLQVADLKSANARAHDRIDAIMSFVPHNRRDKD